MSALNSHLVITVKCAVPGCTNMHRESNHWFLITIERDLFLCRPYLAPHELQPLDLPACGQACAQKLLERFFARGFYGQPPIV